MKMRKRTPIRICVPWLKTKQPKMQKLFSNFSVVAKEIKIVYFNQILLILDYMTFHMPLQRINSSKRLVTFNTGKSLVLALHMYS